MKNANIAGAATVPHLFRSYFRGVALCFGLFGVLCTNVLYANKRISADQPTTTKAVVVPTTMPKEIGDAIKPHFAEFHDFRSGPRTSRYPAGNGMQALHLKKNQTQAVDQLDAGMCTGGVFGTKNKD
jgi:hypothetical protein